MTKHLPRGCHLLLAVYTYFFFDGFKAGFFLVALEHTPENHLPSTETGNETAYIVVFDGGVWPRRKTFKASYLNFRAVKAVPVQ